MGKFSDALKKSKIVKKQPSVEPAPEKVVRMSPEAIDELRLHTIVPKSSVEISALPEGTMDERLTSFIDQHSVAGESFKLLRAKIFRNNLGLRPRTIMVTSPQPMDGKTTVAVNLAVSIARGINEHVMLLDCDLRRPVLGRLLGLNVREGLREYLEKGTEVAPYLVKTPLEKLTFLPAGKPPPNPSELLSSSKMRDLVKELKSRYDDRYIIIDSTPTQFGAETSFLASTVDAALLVVRSGSTAKDFIMDAIENVGREKLLGIVFNASNELTKDYGYYYRYYGRGRS